MNRSKRITIKQIVHESICLVLSRKKSTNRRQIKKNSSLRHKHNQLKENRMLVINFKINGRFKKKNLFIYQSRIYIKVLPSLVFIKYKVYLRMYKESTNM